MLPSRGSGAEFLALTFRHRRRGHRTQREAGSFGVPPPSYHRRSGRHSEACEPGRPHFYERILRTLTRWVAAQAQQGTGEAPWRDKTRPTRTAPGHFGIKLALHTPSHRMCGTKLALLAQNGPIWRVLPAHGELSTAVATNKPRMANFFTLTPTTRPSRAGFLASTPHPHSR